MMELVFSEVGTTITEVRTRVLASLPEDSPDFAASVVLNFLRRAIEALPDLELVNQLPMPYRDWVIREFSLCSDWPANG